MTKKEYYDKLYRDRQLRLQQRFIDQDERRVEKNRRDRTQRNRFRIKTVTYLASSSTLFYLFLAILFASFGSAYATSNLSYLELGNRIFDAIKLFIDSFSSLNYLIESVIDFLKSFIERIGDVFRVIDKIINWTGASN